MVSKGGGGGVCMFISSVLGEEVNGEEVRMTAFNSPTRETACEKLHLCTMYLYMKESWTYTGERERETERERQRQRDRQTDRETDRLVGFLTSSSTTRLYRGRAPRQSV